MFLSPLEPLSHLLEFVYFERAVPIRILVKHGLRDVDELLNRLNLSLQPEALKKVRKRIPVLLLQEPLDQRLPVLD